MSKADGCGCNVGSAVPMMIGERWRKNHASDAFDHRHHRQGPPESTFVLAPSSPHRSMLRMSGLSLLVILISDHGGRNTVRIPFRGWIRRT